MKESDAGDRFTEMFGVVNSIRLMSYAWHMDVRGPEWIAEKISRQQLAKIRASYEAAGVPWGPGTIEWTPILKRLKAVKDNADARARTAKAGRARGSLRTA